MTAVAGALSRQAKAIAGGVLLLLIQLQWIIGQGGYDQLGQLTTVDWIAVAVNTLTGYVGVYAIPNATRAAAAGSVEKAAPSTGGAPQAFSPR